MKKILCLVLCMLMMMGSAMAGEREWTGEAVWFGDWMEVVNCKEYITLRAEPSTNSAELDRVPLGALVRTFGGYDEKFDRVMYEGQAGYVLSEYLFPAPRTQVAYPEVVVSEGTQEAYNIDLFLTNFTEQYFLSPYGAFDVENASDQQLVQFAIEHIWFNRQDYIEKGEWEDGSNVRLSAEYIPAVCEKYFGRVPESKLALFADYFDGYYYWTETGGHTPGGFALMYDIDCVGVNKYKVGFCVYGQGYSWDESVYGTHVMELWQQHPEYFSEIRPYGTAVFYAEDLKDRSSWKLESLVMDWERSNALVPELDWARLDYTHYDGKSMSQTVNDPASLEQLRRMILESEPAELGQCPLSGQLTVQMTDGKKYEFTRATDGCPMIVNANGVVHALSKADSKLFWEIFDGVFDAMMSE